MRYGPVAREMAARHHHVSCEERDNDAGAKVVAEPAILHLPRSNGPAAAVLHLLRGGVEVGRAGLRALSPLPLPLVLGHGWIMTMVASWWGGTPLCLVAWSLLVRFQQGGVARLATFIVLLAVVAGK